MQRYCDPGKKKKKTHSTLGVNGAHDLVRCARGVVSNHSHELHCLLNVGEFIKGDNSPLNVNGALVHITAERN